MGDPGAGKTAFAYAQAISECYNKDRRKQAQNVVFALNAGGYSNLLLPDDHIVYTETSVIGRLFGRKVQTTYICSGARFGLPNDEKETDFYPPYAFIVYDEGQKNVDSRNYKSLADYVKRGWETHRHMGYDILYVSQWGNLDKCLRKVIGRIIYICEKGQRYNKDKYSHIQSWWRYIEFASYEEYENWVVSGKSKRELKEFVFDGDITRCYDGEGYRPLWFKGRENVDFTKKKHKKVEMTIASFNEFLRDIGEIE